ncbi:N1-acetylpolyamine oxidase [Colletotrichum abscissum]
MEAYLRYLSELFNIKKPGQPIARMARLLYHIATGYQGMIRDSVAQVSNISADLYVELRGRDDLSTVEARQGALAFGDTGSGRYDSDLLDILKTYDNLVDLERETHEMGTDYAISMEYLRLRAMWDLEILSPERVAVYSENFIEKFKTLQPPSLDDWNFWRLNMLASTHLELSKTYIDLSATERGVWHMEESVRLMDYLIHGREHDDPRQLAELVIGRMKLVRFLKALGQTERADDVLLAVEKSRYLAEMLRSDLDCKT